MIQVTWISCNLCGFNGPPPHTCEKEKLISELTRLRDELREAMGTLKVIGRPACPYPGTQREACGRCSTCLARAFLEKHGVGE